jgi:hypothetical protein
MNDHLVVEPVVVAVNKVHQQMDMLFSFCHVSAFSFNHRPMSGRQASAKHAGPVQ